MAHKEYTNPQPATASTNKTKGRIRRIANEVVRNNEFFFHEHDIFEVKEVFLDKKELFKRFGDSNPYASEEYYGGITGKYVPPYNSQRTLPDGPKPVLPLDPNIRTYPVPGEYVICINHMGQTYYKTIIGHNNDPNNNIQVGGSSTSKTAKTVEHTIYTNNPDHHIRITANPGDMVLQGRYGNSINLGAHQLTESSIKLVAGHRDYEKYDINKDRASIYIQEGGSVNVKNPNEKFKQYPVGGAKIVLVADDIVINARNNLKLVAGSVTEVLGKHVELKHNKGGDVSINETKELLDNTRDKLRNEVIREIEECIEQILLITDKVQEDFERVKDLIKKLENIKDIPRDVVDMITGAEITLNAEKFKKLQDDYNRLTNEMGAIPDKTKDPVKVARILGEMANVIRQFADVKELFRPNFKLGKPSE